MKWERSLGRSPRVDDNDDRRMGTLAICMNDAQEFFVHASEIADPAWRRKRAEHLTWLLRQPEILAGVHRRVQEQRGAIEQQLVARIKRLTGPALVRRDHSDLQAGAVRLGGL